MDARPSFTSPVVAELATVVEHEAVNAEYRRLALACGPQAAAAEAGQFFQLLCPPSTGAQPFLRRPMSVYAMDPAAGRIEFLYRVSGAGTRGLAGLVPGGLLDILGPLGRGFRLDAGLRHVAIVGRGVGMATLAPLARAAYEAGIAVTALFSARRPDLLASLDLFRRCGAEVLTVTDAEGTSDPGRVERILRGLIDKGRCDAFFTCGSARLTRLLQRLAREFGLPGQVAMEQQMACGLGMCFSCVRDFRSADGIVHRRVCWDGPVFDLHEAMA